MPKKVFKKHIQQNTKIQHAYILKTIPHIATRNYQNLCTKLRSYNMPKLAQFLGHKCTSKPNQFYA